MFHLIHLKAREAEWCNENSVAQCKALPPEATLWTDLECDLWFRSKGGFNPRKQLARHQRFENSVASGESIRDLLLSASQGDFRVLDDVRGRAGRVSVVTPTTESREGYHQTIYDCFDAQTWANKELVVIDTYQRCPSPFFEKKSKEDPRVIYVAVKRPLLRRVVADSSDELDTDKSKRNVVTSGDFSIGLKRNIGAYLSSGEFIANFDDDDLYSPSYLVTMIERMQQTDALAAKLATWYTMNINTGQLFKCDPVKAASEEDKASDDPSALEQLYGNGFSHVYRRKTAFDFPYADLDCAEDVDFFSRIIDSDCGKHGVELIQDQHGVCLHVRHGGNAAASRTGAPVSVAEAVVTERLEFVACKGFGMYMSQVSTHHAMDAWAHKLIRASLDLTQDAEVVLDQIWQAMSGSAKACKALAVKFTLPIQEVQEKIAGFKMAADRPDLSENVMGQAIVKQAQAFDDSVLLPGGEWSPLERLDDGLKVEEYVKVRWTIFMDDMSGQVLLPFGLKGQVQGFDNEGDARIQFPDQQDGRTPYVRKDDFHRLLVWRIAET